MDSPMAQLMKDESTADCVVVVADREILCHKCILANASHIMRTILYKEGVKQWECRIKLDGVSAAGWDTLHNYCYKQAVSGRRGQSLLLSALDMEDASAFWCLAHWHTRILLTDT